MSEWIVGKAILQNHMGLHARPSAKLASVAGKYESEILIEYRGVVINGKSVLDIMLLAATYGAELTIKARGNDAAAAIKDVARIINEGFGEVG